MKKIYLLICFLVIQVNSSCVSVPKEAPVLSRQLKSEIQELENSHLSLVHNFFELKRKNAKEYINKIWLPKFATIYFKKDDINTMWNKIVQEGSAEDRLKFILITGPELQLEINEQYESMIEPLDKMEYELEKALKEKYTNAKSINNSITSFLISAAEVDENRQRYLDMVGVTDDKISKVISQTESISGKMLNKAVKADAKYSDIMENIEDYKQKLTNILNQL